MKQMNTIEEAVQDLREGKIIICIDDPDRENEGDFICAAEFATTENINLMATHGKGLICMPMAKEFVKRLQIPQMVMDNTDNHETAFTVSIDYAGTTTGISAAERSVTAMKVVDDDTRPEDFRRPGHMFPLLAKPNGVLERDGHTEATVDLCKIAGLKACGLCCEIMRDDGTMMRTTELLQLAERFGMKVISIKSLQEYRKTHDILVSREAVVRMPTKYGEFQAYGYVNLLNGEHHVALVKGEIGDGRARRPGEGRDRRREGHPVPRPFRVPHRRHLRITALRLRGTVRRRHDPDRKRGPRHPSLHAPGRPRHRAYQQTEGLRAAGAGHGHRGGEPGPGL